MKPILAVTALLATLAPLSAASADEAALGAPPWNIAGKDWICIQQCATGHIGAKVEIAQNGRRFVFIDDLGQREDAEWMGGSQISFIGCDNNATLSADLTRLDFIFGSVWVR
jgi:hypothetical protein